MNMSEDVDARETWFIFSPLVAPWANLRMATFTKARNSPHLDLVVIHNEAQPERIGVRVWQDIVKTERWFKVRKIEIPSVVEVLEASLKDPPL